MNGPAAARHTPPGREAPGLVTLVSHRRTVQAASPSDRRDPPPALSAPSPRLQVGVFLHQMVEAVQLMLFVLDNPIWGFNIQPNSNVFWRWFGFFQVPNALEEAGYVVRPRAARMISEGRGCEHHAARCRSYRS